MTCEFVLALHETGRTGLPTEVRAEAVRSLLNVVGTSVGAARYDTIDIMVATARKHGGPGTAPVPGRNDRLAAIDSALVTGAAAHIDDFDDTHLATVVHAAASVFAAALPVISSQDVPGVRLINALALGIEAQLRVALAMTPWHYDAGWHITGTVGALGAAVTVGVLYGLDVDELTNAVAVASSMSLGHRQGFGTMVKPFHPGKAAANGLLAAALARRGFTGSPTALEGPRGYFAVLSPEVDLTRLTDGVGERWELLDNTYKPYPCGIVSHPAIEAAERLHSRIGTVPPRAVRVHCHPLVAELTGDPTPDSGLAARFSTIHGVAAGLVDGAVGLRQYDDARVRARDLTVMRAITTLAADDRIARDAATVEVEFADGTVTAETVEHARGSLARRMTDAELDTKVSSLVEQTLPGHAAPIIDITRSVGDSDSCARLISAITPEMP